MSLVHSGKKPVVFRGIPIDPDGTDWVFFTYENWLRQDESIITHLALITGGTIETVSTYLGQMEDQDGIMHSEVYGVQFKPAAGSSQVTITHRKSTTTAGSPSLSRIDIDHTAIIPVVSL